MAFQSTVDRGSQQENIDTLYANWQSMKAQANLAKTTYQRGENLYRQGVISRQRRDEMLAAQTSAQELSEALINNMLEQSAEVPVSRNLQRMHKLRLQKPR